MKRILNRGISFALIAMMLTSTLYGCSKVGENAAEGIPAATVTPIDTSEIAEMITNELREEAEEYQEQTETYIEISENWEDYAGDVDTLVYGLLLAEYEKYYSVFEAVVEDGDSQIYGLGFTDYDYYFETENEGEGYFPAGFIGFIGEEGVNKSKVDDGIEILPLSDAEDGYHFIYGYETDPYMEHCVAWGKYIKYGIDDKGSITYEVEDYQRGTCDETLGSLYSFDENKYVFETDFDGYKYISGASLFEDIDYDALQTEIDRILEEQDYNFADVDVDTIVYMAQEAFDSYLLSLQEETFMGYKVDDLIAISKQIDPKDCIQFSPDGMVIINASDLPGNNPTEFVKWSTGIICGLAVIGCIALDIFVPALMPLSSAIMGATIEVFMEVVVANNTLRDVNWVKVGVAALSGALIAWLSPAIGAGAAGGAVKAAGGTLNVFGKTIQLSNEALMALGHISGYASMVLTNALLSGGTSAAFVKLDGGNGSEALDAFKTGALLGGGLTVVFSAVAAGISWAGSAIAKTHPNNWLVKMTSGIGNWFKDHQVRLPEKVENILMPKSIHQATEAALYELRVQQCGGSPVLVDKILQLPADDNPNFVLKDPQGNPIKKADLASNGGNGVLTLSDDCDPELVKAFSDKGITEIKITNGDVDFAPIANYDFKPTSGITSNRNKNMNNFRKDLANEWSVHPDEIPQNVKDELNRLGCSLDNLKADNLKTAFSNLKLTLHEGTNGMVYLMDRTIHESVGHYGGVALAKTLEQIRIGRDYVEDLAASQVLSVEGTLIGEAVY